MKCTLAAILLALLLVTAEFVEGHEGDGFTHMIGSSGPLIGSSMCGMTTIWAHDDDEDGNVDRCSQVMLVHGEVHLKDIPVTNGTCLCPGREGE